MKKVLTISFMVCALVLVAGCGNKTSKYEETMKEYATTFYNLHQKGDVSQTNPTVSITQLKNVMEVLGTENGDNYDMSKLSKCKDESYVELIIDEATRDVKDVKYHLECE